MTISMLHRSCGAEGRCKFHQLPGHGHRFALASTVGGVLCAVFGYRVGFAAFVVPVVLAVALAVVILSRLEKQERTA